MTEHDFKISFLTFLRKANIDISGAEKHANSAYGYLKR